jgi:hypothetical protein
MAIVINLLMSLVQFLPIFYYKDPHGAQVCAWLADDIVCSDETKVLQFPSDHIFFFVGDDI